MTEPEEVIEKAIMLRLASAGLVGVSVEGYLTPSLENVRKTVQPSFVSVSVDQSSQILDWRGPSPCTWTARISLHVCYADDKDGINFRANARSVRSSLHGLLGDGCSSLDGDGFACDAFVLDSTSTSFDSSTEDGANVKTYTATISGRFNYQENE